MIVVTVKTAVLVSEPLIGIPLQLVEECQDSFIFYLHQDLVNRGSQRGEACEPPCGGIEAPVLPLFSDPSHLILFVLSYVPLSFPLLGLLFSDQQCVFRVHILSSPVTHTRQGFWVVLV